MRHGIRSVVGGAVVAAAVALAAAPAGAAGPPTLSASAFWVTNDSLNTRVSLQGNEKAGHFTSIFLFVTQDYCDTATNERVFLSWFSQGPIPARDFMVRPNLATATLSTTVTVSGSESRSPDCANPGNPTSFTNLGTSAVTVTATWTGTGATYEVQPGITGRAATATGSITGTQLNPGSLGTSQNAELRSSTL